MGNNATISPAAIQGVASPNLVVDPQKFYAATRRMRFTARPLTAFAGIGSADQVQLRQTGIVAALEYRIAGNITFGGTIGTTTLTYEWPFNLIQEFRLAANGQSNLISARGLSLRALEFVTNSKLDDNGGPSITFGATAIGSGISGSYKIAGDDWGTLAATQLNPGANVPSVGVFTVDLVWSIPVAADPVSLIGAIYAQSAATNLTLNVQYATQTQLFSAVGGAATIAYNLSSQVTAVAYSIPNVNGQFVVPDLSQFHQLAEFRSPGLAQGLNQPLLPGTGVGRRLMRLIMNVYSGAIPTPLAMTAANFATVGWAFGGNDLPESYDNGSQLRASNARLSGVDLGGLWGVGVWDFASQFALRDVIDEGTTSDLRILFSLIAAPTSGYAQILQETLFAAPVGA
jgi:hypothetical protein